MKALLRSGAVVSAGLAVEYAGQMIRVLVLARLLGPAEFGIVVSLNALWALVQMSTFIGVDRFLIHAPDGGSRRLLAAAHMSVLGSGLLAAALILLLAWPTAWILGVPEASGSFLALALVPLLRGLMHMRIVQVQRQHVFWPEAATTIIGNVGGLVVTVVAALLLRDHRAIIWGLCGTGALTVAASHMTSRVPYRLSFDTADLRRALRFGLPLTLNGLALAMLGQLDRVVVGALLGVAELGRYGSAMTLVFTPISLLFRVGTSLSQPHLSTAWHGPRRAAVPRLFRMIAAAFALLGAPYAVGVAALGDPMMRWLFGGRFAVGDVFIGLLSFGVLARFAKATVNLGGLAIGRTRDLMLSNLVGATGLAATTAGLFLVPILPMAAIGNLVGEVLATAFIVARLEAYLTNPGAPSPYGKFLGAFVLQSLVVPWIVWTDPPLAARIGLVAVVLAGALATGLRLWLGHVGGPAGIRRMLEQ